MKSRLSQVLSVLVATVLLSPFVHAQDLTYSYSGPATSPDLVRIVASSSGTFNTTPVSTDAAGLTKGIQITVNPTDLKLTFDKTTLLTTAPSSLVQTQNVSVGFGQTKSFTATISLDAINLSIGNATANGVGYNALTAASGGDYDIESTLNYPPGLIMGYLGLSGSISGNLTGTYTIQGPTETATGSFDVPLSWLNYYNYQPQTLSTDGFPSTLALSGSFSAAFNYWFTPTTENFINATVDGVQISTGIDQVKLQFVTDDFALTPGSLSSIPEPSTYVVVFGLTVFGFTVFRRHNRSSKP